MNDKQKELTGTAFGAPAGRERIERIAFNHQRIFSTDTLETRRKRVKLFAVLDYSSFPTGNSNRFRLLQHRAFDL